MAEHLQKHRRSENIVKFAIQAYYHYLPLKKQIVFIIGKNGDEILKATNGLIDYHYIFADGRNALQQLHDIRFDLDYPSVVLSEKNIEIKQIQYFRHLPNLNQLKSDFLRWQDGEKIRGLYAFGKKLHTKMWQIQEGKNLEAHHFSWQSLPMDQCINPVFSLEK